MVLLKNGISLPMSIINGSCYVDGEVCGSSCQRDKESANITLSDVSRQEGLQILANGQLFSTTYFVPNCTFQEPRMGEIDLKTSSPLSRFAKGQSQIELNFGIQVANILTVVCTGFRNLDTALLFIPNNTDVVRPIIC
uniref:DUF5727 domain-containing protein n=1 Tax=Echinococcus canadensis TaxID=519352 RepID=A0A915EVL0_9CEST